MPITLANHGILQATAAQAIPYPTQQRAKAVDSIVTYLNMLRGWGATRFALAGNGASVVQVADRSTHIYARLGGAGGTVIEARVMNTLDRAAIQNGDSLLVRLENPGGAGGWVVLDWFGAGDVPINLCLACEIVARSQLELFTFGTDLPLGGNGVAVRGHYAYVVRTNRRTAPGTSLATSRLFTIDLSDPDAPAIVDDQDVGYDLTGGCIYAVGDTLIFGGLVYVSGTSGLTQTRRYFKYDISTRSAPSFVLTGTARVYPQAFNLFVDEASALYVVGYDWVSGVNSIPDFVVLNAGFSEIGNLTGNYENPSEGFNPPIQCGQNVATPQTGNQLRFIDMSDPSAPALRWDDANMSKALVEFSDHEFYACDTVGGRAYLYDFTVPGTPSKTILPIGALTVHDYGRFVSGTCMFDVNLKNGKSFDCADPLNPTLSSSSTAPLTVLTDFVSNGAADIEGGIVYACTVGLKSDNTSVLLSVFTGT